MAPEAVFIAYSVVAGPFHGFLFAAFLLEHSDCQEKVCSVVATRSGLHL
jgi:hypothetical protein